MKKMTVFIIVLGCLSVFMLGGCADRGAVLESDYYVQIHGKAEKNENKDNYVYNLEGYNEKGKKKWSLSLLKSLIKKGTLYVCRGAMTDILGNLKLLNPINCRKRSKADLI